MRRLSPLSISLSLSMSLVACRDDVVDGPFEPLCDERGPVELLRLGDDEVVGVLWRLNEDGDLFVTITSDDESSAGDTTSSVRRVVIDRCGEEVIELAPDVSSVARWDDALVGCVDGDLARFSDYEDPAPTILARRGCATRSVEGLRLTVDVEPGATIGRLLSLEVVGTEVEVRALLDGVLVGDYEANIVSGAFEGRAWVRTADLAVWSVDPRTGEATRELEEAESWSLDEDVLVYRRPVLDPDLPAPIIIRDRRSGAEQTLDAEIPASWWVGWHSDGVLTAKPPGSPFGWRWFWIDTRRELIAPEGMRIETVRSDGLVWLSQPSEPPGDTTFFRWREGEAPQLAWTCTHCGAKDSPHDDAIDVIVRTRYEHLTDLWRLDDAGGSARLLASGVGYDYSELEHDRILTVPVSLGDQHGPLKLHDGSGGPAVTLVPRVHRSASFLTPLHGEPDEILYEAVPVAASEDDPHALYRARLAP